MQKGSNFFSLFFILCPELTGKTKGALSLRGHRWDGRGACLSGGQSSASTHWPAFLFSLLRIWAWLLETEGPRLALGKAPALPDQALGSSGMA